MYINLIPHEKENRNKLFKVDNALVNNKYLSTCISG